MNINHNNPPAHKTVDLFRPSLRGTCLYEKIFCLDLCAEKYLYNKVLNSEKILISYLKYMIQHFFSGVTTEEMCGSEPPHLCSGLSWDYIKSVLYIGVGKHVCILWLFTAHQQRKIVWTPTFLAGDATELFSVTGSHFWVCVTVTFCEVWHSDSVTKLDYYHHNTTTHFESIFLNFKAREFETK